MLALTANIDVINCGLLGDCAGPFDIQIGLRLRAVETGVGAVEQGFRIHGGQPEHVAEAADIGERDIGLADYRDVLPGAIDARGIERL
jgi:hypothetical protein